MIAFLLGLVPRFLLPAIQAHFQAKRDLASEQERTKREVQVATINAVVESRNAQRDVITAGMQHKAFWVPWLISTVPLACWFAWGVADTIANGALPDVAELPPQLKAYADQAWQNIFFTGAGVAGVTGAAAIIGNAIRKR